MAVTAMKSQPLRVLQVVAAVGFVGDEGVKNVVGGGDPDCAEEGVDERDAEGGAARGAGDELGVSRGHGRAHANAAGASRTCGPWRAISGKRGRRDLK